MTSRALFLSCGAALVALCTGIAAQSTADPASVLERIRREGLDRSQVVGRRGRPAPPELR